MFGLVNKGALKSTVMLLGIGIVMVITLLIFSASLLKTPETENPQVPDASYPTPTPEINYLPNI